MRLTVPALLALFVFGCSPDDEHEHGGHDRHGGGGADLPPTTCAAATNCGACTPIVGCGWCQYADGTGSCAIGPSACAEHTFRWNWDPIDCPAGGPAADAGAEATSDGAATDATCSAPTVAGCLATTGGTLCTASSFTLSCTSVPDAALGCKLAYSKGSELYYCCPCVR